jgi:hypothetical protein
MAEVRPVGAESKRSPKNRIRIFNPSGILPERINQITVPAGSVITIHPFGERGKEQIKPMTRRIYMQKRVSPKADQVTNPAVFLKREEKLRKENELLKKKLESFQDRLDEIADVASASADDSEEDEDQLKGKLNAVLDLAAPGSADEDEEEEDGSCEGEEEEVRE